MQAFETSIERLFLVNLAFSTILKHDNILMVMNASNPDQPGIHWLIFAQADDQFFCRFSWTRTTQLSTFLKLYEIF